MLGPGLATISLIGTGIGIGVIFGALFMSMSRNPSRAKPFWFTGYIFNIIQVVCKSLAWLDEVSTVYGGALQEQDRDRVLSKLYKTARGNTGISNPGKIRILGGLITRLYLIG